MNSPLGHEDWQCEMCTWINGPADLTCTMCFSVRMSAKDVSVQWQWQAADQWIPYDYATTMEIENGYKDGLNRVQLTQGWFASPEAQNSGRYELVFDRASQTHQQINLDTGNGRTVRRIGDDDDSLFMSVEMKEELRGDKCIICQVEFDIDDPSDQAVKLPMCSGHYFHKPCIAQWIKLKDHCPYCKKRIE